ncbi:MAG: ABC transporter ATP-binding protein [Anaerolineales bacterium]|nr:ABC transporter ATP-binding protein [Anaerolineales bacterium]
MSIILEVNELVKRYPGAAEPAVKGISFGVRRGEVFSLLGPNGAGKTTLIGMLSCLLAPTGGDAVVDGHSIRAQADAVKHIIGIVPQDIALYPTLSARENLRFWGWMYGLGGKDLAHRIESILETVGLKDRGNERVDSYSGGMKRRINIAAGLLHRPKLVFLDEPTVGIDPQSRRNILEMVKALNAQGMTVLYTTHYMEEAQELSQRIGIIDHGKLIALGTLDELTRLVGRQDEIELKLAAEHAGPELAEALAKVKGVRGARSEDHTVRLVAENANESLPDVISLTNARGVKVVGIDVREPNLEAVFLHLTGRALRD